MMMGNTITEQVFRVISTVKNYNTVLIDIEVFEIFQMLNGSGAFGSQISMEGSMDDIIVKNVIDDGRKCKRALWAMKRGGASGAARSDRRARPCELPGLAPRAGVWGWQSP